MRKLIAVASLILILIGVNWSIYNKEKQLASGAIAYLKLIPVDPRSLMQGDFMALRFEVANNIIEALPKNTKKTHWRDRNDVEASDGFVVVTLNKEKIATFDRIYTEGTTLTENQIKMQYRVRDDKVKFATNAFFFQEGTAEIYENAKYGQFRVNAHGGLLLTAMYDENLTLLEARNDRKTNK